MSEYWTPTRTIRQDGQLSNVPLVGNSVAEPPLFEADPALAPEVQGPGADSGQIGSAQAPDPGTKRRLQKALTSAPATDTTICNFEL